MKFQCYGMRLHCYAMIWSRLLKICFNWLYNETRTQNLLIFEWKLCGINWLMLCKITQKWNLFRKLLLKQRIIKTNCTTNSKCWSRVQIQNLRRFQILFKTIHILFDMKLHHPTFVKRKDDFTLYFFLLKDNLTYDFDCQGLHLHNLLGLLNKRK